MFLIMVMTMAVAGLQPAPVDPPPAASARLSQPREVRLVIDGRGWACDNQGVCTGRGAGAAQPVMRECRRFVARFGPVAAFARGGTAMGPDALARCNAR